MPIYEYECQKCGHYLEALQKIADKPLRECPECGKHALKRLVSAPMFRLSGSGWYETDFKSDQETKRNLADRGEKEETKTESKDDSKAEAKNETKSEAKTETKSEPKSDATRTESRSSSKPVSKSTGKSSGGTHSARSRTLVAKPSRPARAARPVTRASRKTTGKAKR
jgi:putative FmdB family regulatory protein